MRDRLPDLTACRKNDDGDTVVVVEKDHFMDDFFHQFQGLEKLRCWQGRAASLLELPSSPSSAGGLCSWVSSLLKAITPAAVFTIKCPSSNVGSLASSYKESCGYVGPTQIIQGGGD
uniref:Syntaxin 2 n=1 Tax=Homo sapiens TaxID=9606 RepID=A0A994J7R5_HUMAN